jgi:hypothetical protein
MLMFSKTGNPLRFLHSVYFRVTHDSHNINPLIFVLETQFLATFLNLFYIPVSLLSFKCPPRRLTLENVHSE